MKTNLISMLLVFALLTACAPAQTPGAVQIDDPPDAAPQELTENPIEPVITTEEPVPTQEPTPSATPVLPLYSTNFSEGAEDWEVLISEETTNVFQEDGQYALEATGISGAVVSSPMTVAEVSEVSMEVDVTFAQTDDIGGSAGIVCGYTSSDEFYGIGIQKTSTGYQAIISITHDESILSPFLRTTPSDLSGHQTYRLKAICSPTGLGLIIDGNKIFHYPMADFSPGRVGLFSTGAYAFGSSGFSLTDKPNTVMFDNFTIVSMQPQDEWVRGPVDPFEHLSFGEVIYSEDSSAPIGEWTSKADSGQSVELDNNKLLITNPKANTLLMARLESIPPFESGVMVDTDFTISPGSPERNIVGFFCDYDGDSNLIYEVRSYGLGEIYFSKYSDGKWTNIGTVLGSYIQEIEHFENGRTYHLTGICGAGYLTLLIDGISQLYIPIPEQNFHSVGLVFTMAYGEVGTSIIQFDNFKITRVDPINE